MKVNIFTQESHIQAQRTVIALIIILCLEFSTTIFGIKKFLGIDKPPININSIIKYMNLWVTIAVVLGVCDVLSDDGKEGTIKDYVEWGFLIGLFIYVPMCSFLNPGITSLVHTIYGIILVIFVSMANYGLSRRIM